MSFAILSEEEEWADRGGHKSPDRNRAKWPNTPNLVGAKTDHLINEPTALVAAGLEPKPFISSLLL